jgi:DNA-binding IclR family transcriptional regulator
MMPSPHYHGDTADGCGGSNEVKSQSTTTRIFLDRAKWRDYKGAVSLSRTMFLIVEQRVLHWSRVTPVRSMAQPKSNPGAPAPILAVSHSLKLVDALAATGHGRGVTELSEELRLAKSTVYRLLQTLVGHGYVVQDSPSGRYHLGLKFLELGALVSDRLSIRMIAQPHLRRLMEATNETVHLGLLEGHEVVYADKIECSQTIRMYSRVGRRSPLHCTALGKALLAYQPETALRENLRKGLRRRTARTITTPRALRAELRRVREKGYASDDEEFEEGLRCLAAPVRDHTEAVVASLGIAGPAGRLDPGRLPGLVKLVQEAAEAVSAALGYKGALPTQAGRDGASGREGI